jgi:hypothetical protein
MSESLAGAHRARTTSPPAARPSRRLLGWFVERSESLPDTGAVDGTNDGQLVTDDAAHRRRFDPLFVAHRLDVASYCSWRTASMHDADLGCHSVDGSGEDSNSPPVRAAW